MRRLHYLDNLRWISILALFPFHAAFVFSAGWYGYYVLSAHPSSIAYLFTVSVEPWIMPLLFCIAGMSTKFALMKRTPLAYLKERFSKLLVPFLTGLVVVCPVIAFYAMKFHTGYTGTFAGAFIHFFTSVLAGNPNGLNGDFSTDHLWFILALFIISVVTLAAILLGRWRAVPALNPEKIGLPILGVLFIPLWLLNFIGIYETGYSLVSYLALFLIGYSLIALDEVQGRLEQYWAILLALWILLTTSVMVIGGLILGHSEVFWGFSPFYVLTGWTGVLALIGAGRHLLDVTNPYIAYLGAASYPVYILHQAVLVAIAYYTVKLSIPAALQFAVIVTFSIVLTFACYEVLRRMPGIRVLFGVKNRF